MDPRAALVIAALGCASVVRAQPNDVALDDPSGRALAAFHDAIGRGRARAMFWGASHTASDQYTGALRADWQRRYGDGGPGLVLPVRAFSLYDHRDAIVAGAGWRIVRGRAPGAYGPHGIALDASGPARASVELPRGVEPVDEIGLYFLRQPNGGTIELRAGEVARQVRTDGAGGDVVTLRGAIHRVEIRAMGDGPVRVFGVSLERRAGVIVDALGIPGARMRDRLPWDDGALRPHLARLDPDLVVLAYGTNESGGRGARDEERTFDEAVRRLRALAPEASCVLIGPSDWPRREGGAFIARPRTTEVSARLRAAAVRHGCGYFDLVRWMGGPGSMPRWVAAGLALDDHVHLTDAGYALLARALARALSPR